MNRRGFLGTIAGAAAGIAASRLQPLFELTAPQAEVATLIYDTSAYAPYLYAQRALDQLWHAQLLNVRMGGRILMADDSVGT